MIHGFGISADLERQLEQLKSLLGRDFNSLLTVARVSDNTLRVRLGAQSAASGYAMVPRTHNITILLLIPDCDAQPVARIVAKSEVVDIETGVPLKARTQEEADRALHSVLQTWVREVSSRDSGK
jgi:hypothetical protein